MVERGANGTTAATHADGAAIYEVGKTVSITTTQDASTEDHETFLVNLSNASAGTIVDGVGVGTITNNDGAAIRNGYRLQFDGTDDFISVSDGAQSRLSMGDAGVSANNFSFEAWVYHDGVGASTNDVHSIAAKGANSANFDWQIYLLDSAGHANWTLAFYDGLGGPGGATDFTMAAPDGTAAKMGVPDNTWTHVAVTYSCDGNTSNDNDTKLYVNGIAQTMAGDPDNANGVAAVSTSATALTFGKSYAGEFYNCLLYTSPSPRD